MSRNYQVYLQDILTVIEKITAYTRDLDLEGFLASQIVIDAVNMNLIIVGEAARNVPENVQQKYPEVDWRNVIGLRNMISHEYFRLNLDRIWDIVQVALPELREQVKTILQNESGDDKASPP